MLSVRKILLDHCGQTRLGYKVRVFMKLVKEEPIPEEKETSYWFDFELKDQEPVAERPSVFCRARVRISLRSTTKV
jgi:hypothetical protein